MASGRAQSGAFGYRLFVAQMINRLHGGPVIAEWEVDELDEVTIDRYVAMATELPAMSEGISKIEARKAEIRSKFLQ